VSHFYNFKFGKDFIFASNLKTKKMQNLLNWFEIPAIDFNRAVAFYRAVLALEIHETEMYGTKMGLFPMDGQNVSGAVVQGDGYTPAKEGTLVYLNGGNDLQTVLNRVEQNQGTIIVPKTQISEEMGYFAIFLDTEGNKMGVHSPN